MGQINVRKIMQFSPKIHFARKIFEKFDMNYLITFRENEHLGPENRTTEFKSGPAFVSHGFREKVAKYVCGFVNSHENGSVLIGVDDKGYVQGYNCSHKQEDNLRCSIDEAIKDIVPSIFPDDYSVRFVPVLNEHGSKIGNLKVIEINVKGADIEVKDQLYCNKQGAFMRRDGSIQELKANEIQDWICRRYQGDLKKMKKNEENLQKDLQNVNMKLVNVEEEVKLKNRELERQRSTLSHMADKNRELIDEVDLLKKKVEQNEAKAAEVVEHENQKKQSKVCVIS